eukprot:11008002-Lingulodinium_polyedra.AAC.1
MEFLLQLRRGRARGLPSGWGDARAVGTGGLDTCSNYIRPPLALGPTSGRTASIAIYYIRHPPT